ncbi:unnamed protein product [Blepharisma stoltei]|uniref:DNA-3-methyladenine glycosylase II n=1 Tax=Blepharisma stoltei TaxID=1481888 RepID=A0AAU9IAH2_9CILI|nr:unnamed protein product [Blepharisma stoltei]
MVKKVAKKALKNQQPPKAANKRPLSAYMLFAQARKDTYRSTSSNLSSSEIAKKIGNEWKQLDESQRAEWQARAASSNDPSTTENSIPILREEPAQSSGLKTELPLSFYQQDTVTVARELIGKVMEHTSEHGTIATIINEAEAYTQDEASCHAFKGKSERNKAMFAEPGTIYLYYVYGQNICINFKTEYAGRGCAVLIRGCLPLRGDGLLLGGEGVKNKKKMLNGPAKLVKSMRIPMAYYGKSVLDNDCPIKIYDEGYRPIDLQTTPRIGISQAKELPWRFLCKDVQKEDLN